MNMVYQIYDKKKKTKNLSHCWIIHFFIVTDSFHCWNYCVISTNNFESGDDHSSINMHYQFTVNNYWYLQFERFKDWTDNIIHNFWKKLFPLMVGAAFSHFQARADDWAYCSSPPFEIFPWQRRGSRPDHKLW